MANNVRSGTCVVDVPSRTSLRRAPVSLKRPSAPHRSDHGHATNPEGAPYFDELLLLPLSLIAAPKRYRGPYFRTRGWVE